MEEIEKYFNILGVKPGTPPQEIKAAYIKLAHTWHPDRYAHNPVLHALAEQSMKEINVAYDTVLHYKPEPVPEAPPMPAAPKQTMPRFTPEEFVVQEKSNSGHKVAVRLVVLFCVAVAILLLLLLI